MKKILNVIIQFIIANRLQIAKQDYCILYQLLLHYYNFKK